MTSYDNNKRKTAITFDYDLYAHYLDDEDLSEDQKREFLETLWNIICEFVAMGYEVHPLQQAIDVCGKDAEIQRESAFKAQNAVNCKDQFKSKSRAPIVGAQDETTKGA